MGDFIYFTEEQKERANAVHIADILRREHEEVERSGNEWRWKRHRSVTFRFPLVKNITLVDYSTFPINR